MTSEVKELVERLQRLLVDIGPLPICPEWTYSCIRHGQRNMDFDVQDGFNEPERQSGMAMGKIVNALPTLLDTLQSQERRIGELTRAIDGIADDYHPDHDREAPLALQEMRDALKALTTGDGHDGQG